MVLVVAGIRQSLKSSLMAGVALGVLSAGVPGAMAEDRYELSDGEELYDDVTTGAFGQAGGAFYGTANAQGYVQSGGSMSGTVYTDSYGLSGGVMENGSNVTTGSYEQSGGTVGWTTVVTDTYLFTGGDDTGDAVIEASGLFTLSPEGDVTLGGKFTGAGTMVKTGDATVTLVGAGNDFTGDIVVEAGVLEFTEGFQGAQRTGDLAVHQGATFRSLGGMDTNFRGAMTGAGTFEQANDEQFGIGADDIDMGMLKVTKGTFRVGTAYFDVADDTGFGESADAHFGTVHLGGPVPEPEGGGAPNDVNGLGTIAIEHGSVLRADRVEISAGSLWSPANEHASGQGAPGKLVAGTIVQSGGLVTTVDIETGTYELSGGRLTTDVTFHDLFTLSGDAVVTGALTSAGNASTFTQTGGSYAGNITVGTFNFSGGSLGGWVSASGYINVSAAADSTLAVTQDLRGTAGLTKTGAGRVTLSNRANSFAGTVSVEAGVLEAIDTALPNGASVEIAAGAALQLTTNTNINYSGNMTGQQGDLIKSGSATATLTGYIDLGDLWLDAGRLNIGNGTSTNQAIFDSAMIAEDATLYIASGATLTIRIPQHIVNNGTLINDGTVHDDLDNNGEFTNNKDYNADVATNTGTIDNNQPGYWTGDIESNEGTITNAAGATWAGAVESNVRRIVNHGTWINGTVEMNGPGYIDAQLNDDWSNEIWNSDTGIWNGDIEANFMRIANAGGRWNGDVLSNDGTVINDNKSDEIGTGYWVGDVDRNAGWIFNGGGGDWTGDVLGNLAGGTIENDGSEDDAGAAWHGTWHGDVLENAGLVSNAGYWIGDVVANSGRIDNRGLWTGDALSNAGRITTVSTWDGSITSAGTLWASGIITGAVSNTGTLMLLDDLSVASISYANGSRFEVDVGAGEQGEMLTVTGAAQLNGTLHVRPGHLVSDDYTLPQVIITAGSISGRFDEVTSDFFFLNPQLDYTSTTASVTLQRNAREFTAVGGTDNQRGVAEQLQALGEGNSIYDAVLWLTQEEAQAAFDRLSGEVYASARAGAVQNAGLVGDIALHRLDMAFEGVDARGSASGYAATAKVEGSSGEGIWTQLYGAYGKADGGAGTASSEGWTGGVAAGLDGLVGDWRVGLMVNAGTGAIRVGELSSSISSIDYGLGGYAGTNWSNTRLKLMGAYTAHANTSTRSVDFLEFSEELSADYLSATAQAGGEVSHTFDFGAVSLVPYARASYVNHAMDGFRETGGDAALTHAAGTTEAAIGTIGAAANYQTVVGDGMLLTASGTVGWRHVFADRPTASVAFGDGAPIPIVGTLASGDVAVIGAGLNLDLDDTTALDLAYDGQFGAHQQSHAVSATWSGKY